MGNPGHWRATLSDITASKEGEQHLLDAQARLKRVAGIADVGFLEWDPRTGAIALPPEVHPPTSDVQDAASPQNLDAWLARLHPEDREAVRTAFTRFATDGEAPLKSTIANAARTATTSGSRPTWSRSRMTGAGSVGS
jgi:hypothetical protein